MIRIQLILACLLLGPGLLFGQQPSGLTADLEVAQRLSAILQDMHTLEAGVEQLTLDQNGREVQVFQARLKLSKPDHFSWQILSPYEELMTTNGEYIWRYEPDLEQVTIETFSNDLSRTPVLLLNGDAQAIADSYTISASDMGDGMRQRFILHPKAPDSLFERLSLTFAGTTLEEMQFEDSLGQKTSLSFSDMTMNAAIDEAAFIFSIPDGVEVMDNTDP